MDPLLLLALGIVVVVGGIAGLRLNAFFALLLGALVVALFTPAGMIKNDPGALARVTAAFGNTCGKLGIMIALASVIGRCLLESGAADRIVRGTLRLVGEKSAGVAFLASSFVLAIPIFFDTVFYLLIPLVKATRLRTGKNLVLYVIAITAGGTITHSLVPPTPGPLQVADALKVNIGIMIVMGLVVGAITSTSGYLYALWINSRLDIPLRDTSGMDLEQLQNVARREDRELPPMSLSLLPILLPIVLIAGYAVLQRVYAGAPADGAAAHLLGALAFWGDPNIALGLAAIIAAAVAIWKRPDRRVPLPPAMQEALKDAGLIILITSAGGAFGAMLQQSGVGGEIGDLASHYQIGLLPLAWAVTALVRSAQGSATVAMVTAIGIINPLVNAPGAPPLPYHAVYIAIAIGCGSKIFPWMNDSAFWIISRMSGFTPAELMKTFSAQLCVMGVVGLLTTMLLAKLLPLV